MAYTLHTNLANSGNYGNSRSTGGIKYIVIHYTGNTTDTAKANSNYFVNNVVGASAHYFVDATTVYQSVPDNVVAWSVGGSKYTDCASTGGGTMYGTVTNDNSISVELCSTAGAFSEATLANAATLVKELMDKYNIEADHVYRHFDVNGKHCPKYWMTGTGFTDFKNTLTTTAEDTELAVSVSKIIHSGISINFNQWKRTDLIKIANVPGLINKLGGIDKLVQERIISQRVIWDKGTYTVNNVRSLLIKYASTL